MKISKITSFKSEKGISLNQQKTNLYSNKNRVNITNPSLLFQPYIGRDIVSFGRRRYSETLKDNYYQLPTGCYPDAFQIDAGKALNDGKTVLVEAPTGTGKTAVAYYVATKNMQEGKKTFYTAPLKALSNQKLNEFKNIYGEENIGILTGDRRENVEAPILIMTTEVYRNMALSNLYGEDNPLMRNLGTVIFDEFHYLGDKDRGPVWEESLIFTPKDVQTLELSATIGNPKALRNWIGSLNGTDNVALVSIPSEARHVPLSFDMLTTQAYEKAERRIEKAIRRGETPDFENTLKVKKPKLSDFKLAVEQLQKEEKLPAIFFIFSKKYSREVLEYMGKEGADLTTQAEKEEIKRIVDKYSAEKYIGADLDTKALEKGYAIHNSGIIPGQKELIEELFQKKLLKAVIATETLAAGINMPAKTVVISSPYKPCDDGEDVGKLLSENKVKMEERDETEEKVIQTGEDSTENNKEREQTPVRMLSANEFKQMSGRAGRRGIDTIGYVYTMPTDRVSEQDFLSLEAMDCNPIESNYNPDYAFLSGYYEHNVNDKGLPDIFGKTFYAYSDDENQRKSKIDELMEISSRKRDVLLSRGFLIEEDGIIEPTLLAKMASKVKGYDTLTLVEAISSKAFEGLSPLGLAMIASSMALPAKSNETAIGYDTDLSYIFEKTEESVGNIQQKLSNSVASMLAKFGKTMESFASYEDMLKFVEGLTKPDVSAEDIKSAMNELEQKRAKMYRITKTTGNYSIDEIVGALKNGDVIPTKVLESNLSAVQTYKKRINARTIDDYIEKLDAELEGLDTTSKGNKAKARIERKRKEVEASIQTAENMKYLEKNIPDALAANHQFIKKNPPSQVKEDYNDAEMAYLKLTMKDVLISRIKALQALDESETEQNSIDKTGYDSKKVNSLFKKLLKKSAEIYNEEIDNGINPGYSRYNKDAAQIAYMWTSLNNSNPYESMSNWAQLIRTMGDKADEGTIYRNIMQTADLLSQIGEIAEVGLRDSKSDEDREYYSSLKYTAIEARKLLLQEPVNI